MDDAVNNTKIILVKQIGAQEILYTGVPFSKYQKVYCSTNENIAHYMNFDMQKDDKVLTVLGGGDHAFNVITRGALNVDTFDTNELTEYYTLGLKKALILKNNYKDYLLTLRKLLIDKISIEKEYTIIKESLPYMDDKYKNYWQKIIDFNYRNQPEKKNIPLLKMLLINLPEGYINTNINNYLKDSKEYNKLRKNLANANITFTPCNATDLSETFNKKYNYILLSNILDYFYREYGVYWDYDILHDYEQKLESITAENGVIYLNYIFNYLMGNIKRHNVVAYAEISDSDLNDEKIKTFPNRYLKHQDAVLYRKKN